MLMNRSAPNALVVPVLRVSDVRAAVAWYSDVFGFVEHVQIGEGHRAQLGLPGGGAELVVAELGELPTGRSHQIMLKVEDAAAVVERATKHGAKLLEGPTDQRYGERQAAIEDVFGHEWVINQTLVDTAPEEWGGRTVVPRG
jgi:PhnB protein